jgi:hypothetical protein
MTGQPETLDELQAANKRADNTVESKGFDDNDNMPEADSLEEYRAKKEERRNEKSDDEKLAELREFKETVREQGNDELGVYGEPQTDDETTMTVTDENGDTQELTEEEVNSRRDVRERTWKLLDRKGGMYVKVAHWFNDADVNKVKSGRGFHGFKTDETEKALQIEVPGTQGRTASDETVWVPKKAVQTYELT